MKNLKKTLLIISMVLTIGLGSAAFAGYAWGDSTDGYGWTSVGYSSDAVQYGWD